MLLCIKEKCLQVLENAIKLFLPFLTTYLKITFTYIHIHNIHIHIYTYAHISYQNRVNAKADMKMQLPSH